MASEIVERNPEVGEMVLVGIKTRGEPLARRLQAEIYRLTGVEVPVGSVDISFYRDDLSLIGERPEVKGTYLPCDINGKLVVLVDDVLYTGRTVRAAIDELLDYGRPRAIRLCILLDRGHRELPISPDCVGKSLTTAASQFVEVRLREVDGVDEAFLLEKEEP